MQNHSIKLLYLIILLCTVTTELIAKRKVFNKTPSISTNIKLIKTDLGFLIPNPHKNAGKLCFIYYNNPLFLKKTNTFTLRWQARVYPIQENIFFEKESLTGLFFSSYKNLFYRYINEYPTIIWKSLDFPINYFGAFKTVNKSQAMNEVFRLNNSNMSRHLYYLHDCKLIFKQDNNKTIYALSFDSQDVIISEINNKNLSISDQLYYGIATAQKTLGNFECSEISVSEGIDKTPTQANCQYPRFISDHYRKLIKNYGDIDAMYWLGMNYYEGSHGELKDYYQAVYWFHKAAKKDHVLAKYQLGLCYMLGAGVNQKKKDIQGGTPDYDTAYSYFIKSAKYHYDKAVAMCMYLLISGKKYISPIQLRAKIKHFYYLENSHYLQGQSSSITNYYYSYSLTHDQFSTDRNMVGIMRAAQYEYPDAYYVMAELFRLNKTSNQGAYFRNYLKAANLDFMPGMVKTADCYYTGHGTDIDYKQAFNWYQKAAKYGDSWSEFRLGCCYALGTGIKKNLEKAKKLFKIAAEKELPQAMMALALLKTVDSNGMKLFFQGKEKVAFKQWQQAQTTVAIFCRALCLKYGIGTKQDFKIAAVNLEKVENIYAQFELGKSYENGNGVRQNLTTAITHYWNAAKMGSTLAAYYLAELYQKQSKKGKAAYWYKIASKNGDANASFKLGELYFYQIPRNYKAALLAFKQAAKLGNIRALYCIGDIYYKGLGVKKNKQQAAIYWTRYETAYKQHDNNSLTGFYWKKLTPPPIKYAADGMPMKILSQFREKSYGAIPKKIGGKFDKKKWFNNKGKSLGPINRKKVLKYYKQFFQLHNPSNTSTE